MWKIDPKARCIHKNKHDHTRIYVENIFVVVEQLYGTWRGEKGKENDRESTISRYIPSVQVEDVMM
jgi:hypothetical protein